MTTISRILARCRHPLLLLAILGFAACGGGGGGGGAPAVGEVALTAASLTGEQVVPPEVTGGTGSASLILTTDRSQFNFALNLDGIFTSPITQAHFHNGVIGTNGPIIFWICTDLGNAPAGIPAPPSCTQPPATISGSFTAADLDPNGNLATFADAVNALLNGNMHIMVHTENNPPGEIRGQVGPAQFSFAMTGDQEVPPVLTGASGSGQVSLNGTQTQVDFTANVANFTIVNPVTEAHVHTGLEGTNGSIIFFICTDLGNAPVGVPAPPLCSSFRVGSPITGTFTQANFIPAGELTSFAEAVDALITGKTYVNVHSVPHPEGEIRGQIRVAFDSAAQRVLFVDNTRAPGGDGTLASPLATLAAAEAASAPGDTIFVFAGSGTAGQDSGITLKANQKLIGQGVGLATSGIAPGAFPVISNAVLGAPDNTPAVMLSTNNEVAGLTINAVFNEGVLALGGSGHTIRDNIFTFSDPALDQAREGVRLLNVSGINTVARNSLTGSGRAGIKLANNENQAGNPVAATPIVATVTMTSNTITISNRGGIEVSLDGTGTAVILNVLSNAITASANEGVDIDVFGQANISALAELNEFTGNGGAGDLAATINDTSTICLELVDNGNRVVFDSTFLVNNNTGVDGAFEFFEDLNDNPATRIGIISDVPQGSCGL